MNMLGLFGKRLGPLSVGGWLSLFFVALVGNVILSYTHSSKTNRVYLKEVIESGTIEKTAAELVASAKKADNKTNEAEWKHIEKGLSECMAKESTKYLASDDPYLDEKADKTSPHVLVKRILKSCGVAD